MKLSKNIANILFVFLVSVTMTAVMSFAILATRLGFSSDFFVIWLSDFLVGCLFSIPTGFLVVPLLKKGIDRITEE
ncbi:MAG: DUF2798 domain-containing protein [Cyclobacteriaceae bacterium]